MNAVETSIPGVLIIEPKVFGDARGFFFESYNRSAFKDATGVDVEFIQDNHSRSQKNVLRGLHFQTQQPQGKLVRVVSGKVFDVVVDIRHDSTTYGKWEGFTLDAVDHKELWVPPGLAHGFVVLSDTADFLYKTTAYYAPQFEKCISWNDASLNIEWPLDRAPSLSAKDLAGVSFEEATKGG